MISFSKNLTHLRKLKGLTQEELGVELGKKRTTITSWEKGENTPDLTMLYKLTELFNVSLSDLLERDLTINMDKGNAILIDMDEREIMEVPFIGQYAYGGYLRGYADEPYLESLPKTPWLVDRQHKGRYISIEVRGDSMDDGSRDSYMAHDILLCREVKPEHWTANKLHIHKWDFVIVHKTDGILVKKIIKHDVAKEKIIVHSLNSDEFPDQEIELKDVAKIFNVVQVKRDKK